ncbi:DNA polymerase III subunit beta [Sphingomonas sp. S2-65]|uniref:DNA polymerase III subunit beta n=1 Tax=Sphingomonas sp. S2-65 TaxID=2903960 RepID=UPI001F41BBAC|nr:DNA polymerase III subunit beta [Sphingomonas sp. S2-65]UYY60124.1 DNA polymerase III subunit beta [Sphingomonas sp. S2-65]
MRRADAAPSPDRGDGRNNGVGSMKIEVERDALLGALRQVADVVQSRQTIPILANVLLIAEAGALSITGTDLDLQATSRVEAAGELQITTDSSKLVAAVTSLKPGKITLSVEDRGQLVLKQGRGKRSLPTLPAKDFPKRAALENAINFRMPGASLARLLDATSGAMSIEDTRYYLKGVFLHVAANRLFAAATDGLRLIRADVAVPDGAEEMPDTIVPDKAVAHLRKLLGKDGSGEIGIEITADAIGFELGSTRFLSKVVDGSFPDYTRVIPPEEGGRLDLARSAFLEPVQGVASVLNAEGEKTKVRALGFYLKEGEEGCEVRGKDSTGAQAQEVLDADFRGVPVEFGVNHRFAVIAGSIFADSAKLTLWVSGPANPIRITSDKDADLLAVVMPMRI